MLNSRGAVSRLENLIHTGKLLARIRYCTVIVIIIVVVFTLSSMYAISSCQISKLSVEN